MAIIAVLLALGATGLLAARNSSEVDAVTEELVSGIRGAQNNAVAVKNDCTTQTKAWGIKINGSSNFGLYKFCIKSDGSALETPALVGANLSPFNSVSLNTSDSSNAFGGWVIYSTPFGKGSAYSSTTNPTWTGASGAAQEWIPSNPNVGETTIRLEKSGYFRLVKIQANGDVRAE
jgi:type II secretory pathway pseudopilin PulG